MGVTINITVNPAMLGWLAELYYYYPPDWIKFYEKTTDSSGKIKFTASASSYPVSFKVKVPAQTMGGVEYEGQEKTVSCYDGDVKYLTFNMEPVSPPPEEGKASIIEVSLPNELTKDSWITGYVRIKNIGTATARFRHFLTTEWNGKESKTEADLRPGDVLRVNFYEGGLVMPSQDALMTIRAQRLKDGVWITDDTKTH